MPKLLKTPFAIDAAEGFRTDIQEITGAAPNSATYQVGFPPVTMQSIALNGMPPKGSDLNGVLYDITDNLVFLTQGGGYGFDAAYATSIGGYPLNARLRLTNGDIVKSTIDGNTNNPNVDLTGWLNIGNTGEVESIAELLAIPNPKNGTRMFVKSYNSPNYALENPFAGGGTFIYNESKESINDGVTIFNGWMRDLSDKILTTEDAGLVAGDGTDATAKIKAIVAALKDGFTFKIISDHCVTSQINIKYRKGLTICGGGKLDAFTLRDSFIFDRDTDYQTLSSGETGNLGILSMYDCHHIDISNVKIRGCKKNTGLEWGDCAVRYERCSFISIHDNDFQGFAGWSIFGFRSDDCNAYGNYIEDVSRQSGIDIFYGGERNYCHDNTVINCGLYGIEIETGVDVDNTTVVDSYCHSNTVLNCKGGIVIANKQSRVGVYGNTIERCLYAFASIYVTYDNSAEGVLNNYIHSNIINNCYIGGMINASKHVKFVRNNIHVDALPDYFIRDQYFSTMFIDSSDRKIFWTMYSNNYKVGDVIKVRNGVYTIDAIDTDNSVNPYGDLAFKKITLNRPLDSEVQQNDNIMLSKVSGGFTNAIGAATRFIDSGSTAIYAATNEDVHIIDNIFTGDIYTAIHQGSDFGSEITAPREFIIGNTIATNRADGRAIRLPKASKATLVEGNPIASQFNLISVVATVGGDTSNIIPSGSVVIQSSTGVASGQAAKSHNFNSAKPRILTGVSVILENWSSSVDVELVIGLSNVVLTIPLKTTTQEVTLTSANNLIGAVSGLTKVQLRSAGNVASIGSYRIELFYM